MRDFDSERTRAHRLAEAEADFPLLRGCPNTSALARLAFLDALEKRDKLALSDQLSDLDDAQAADANMSVEAREALLRALPLANAFLSAAGARAPAQGVAFLPVKLYAGICKDDGVGGFDGWARLVGMSDAARAPAPQHAASRDELVPVAPGRLRKRIEDAMFARFGARGARIAADHTRYSAPLPSGDFTVDLRFARGMGPSYQFDYHFSARLTDGRSVWMKAYESVWRTPSRWDYVTEANAERSVAHFVRLMEASLSLL